MTNLTAEAIAKMNTYGSLHIKPVEKLADMTAEEKAEWNKKEDERINKAILASNPDNIVRQMLLESLYRHENKAHF